MLLPCSIDNVRPPVFMYPSEKEIEGGTTVFRALWQKMQDRDVVAICRYEAREGMAPRFLALFPEVRTGGGCFFYAT